MSGHAHRGHGSDHHDVLVPATGGLRLVVNSTIGLGWRACQGSHSHTRKVLQPMHKIFIFGDSIAYGAWDPEGGWVERLRRWLFGSTRGDYNLGTFLYNLSIVGETTADLLKRFTPELEARQHGDIIFFAAGINDAQVVHGRQIATPADVCANVRALIQRARACASLLCWVGLTPVDESRTTPIPWMPDRAYRNGTIAAFDAAIKQTAAEEAIPYIDLFHAWTADRAYHHLLLDGIHPNAAGHEQIYAQVKAFLVERNAAVARC